MLSANGVCWPIPDNYILLVLFYEVKECLYNTHDAGPCERTHVYAHDQNVQFLCLCQFLSNYKG